MMLLDQHKLGSWDDDLDFGAAADDHFWEDAGSHGSFPDHHHSRFSLHDSLLGAAANDHWDDAAMVVFPTIILASRSVIRSLVYQSSRNLEQGG